MRIRMVAAGAAGLVSLTLFGALALAGCGGQATARDGKDVLFQYSTLNALMAGVYEGQMTLAELEEHGQQGLGTINTLDGEMVLLDGTAYRVGFDGTVGKLAGDVLTPFAEVTDFSADITLPEDQPLSFDQLKAAIDAARTSANLPYAFRVDGTFASIKTRSVPAQTRPYRPLTEVLKGQSEFQFTNVQGTIVGFWLPAYMSGPNAAGYHMHFLTADRKGGGHVLDLQTANVTIKMDETSEWVSELPTSGDFRSTALSQEQYK